MKAAVLIQWLEIIKVVVIEDLPPIPTIRYQRQNFQSIFVHLRNLSIDFSEKFRFINIEQLRRIRDSFQFTQGQIKVGTYSTNAEEIILISIARLSWPHRWSDLMLLFVGRKRWFLGRCFYWFLNFMVDNWPYLLVNNIDFWIPYLYESCEAIRKNLRYYLSKLGGNFTLVMMNKMALKFLLL